MLETLICTADENAPHEFVRERKRGVKPSICPACKVARENVRQEMQRETSTRQTLIMDDDMAELIDLYKRDGNSLPRRVLAAFIADGMEPPPSDRVDRIGYTITERIILERIHVPQTDDLANVA